MAVAVLAAVVAITAAADAVAVIMAVVDAVVVITAATTAVEPAAKGVLSIQKATQFSNKLGGLQEDLSPCICKGLNGKRKRRITPPQPSIAR